MSGLVVSVEGARRDAWDVSSSTSISFGPGDPRAASVASRRGLCRGRYGGGSAARLDGAEVPEPAQEGLCQVVEAPPAHRA